MLGKQWGWSSGRRMGAVRTFIRAVAQGRAAFQWTTRTSPSKLAVPWCELIAG